MPHRDLAGGRPPRPRRVRPGARRARPGRSAPAPAAAARARRPPARRGRVPRAAAAAVGGADEPAAACLRLGAEPARARRPGGVAGHGRRERVPQPACPRLPGPASGRLRRGARAGGARAEISGALRAMDESVARELLASGRPAWQVLAGAMPGRVRDRGNPLRGRSLRGLLPGRLARRVSLTARQRPANRRRVHTPRDLVSRRARPDPAAGPAGAVPYTSGSPAMSSSGSHGPAGPAPVLTGGPPAAQPLHPAAVHPEHLAGQPGRGVRREVDDEPGGVGRVLRIEAVRALGDRVAHRHPGDAVGHPGVRDRARSRSRSPRTWPSPGR